MAVHPSAKRPKPSLAGFKKAATTAKAKKPGFQITHGGKTMGFHKAKLAADAKARLAEAKRKDALLAADAVKRASAGKKWTDKKVIGAGASVTAWRARQAAAAKKRAEARAQRSQERRDAAKQFISGTIASITPKPKVTSTTKKYYRRQSTTTTIKRPQ